MGSHIQRRRRIAAVVVAIAVCSTALPVRLEAQSIAGTDLSMRDGAHDLDFAVGFWHADITRFLEPFQDPAKTTHLAGTITVRPIWKGRGELEEIEVATPKGNWEAASLYLYDPVAHQWSRNYVNSDVGRLDGSPKIGRFRGGEMVLFSHEEFEGRAILVREAFYRITRDSHEYEEDYSADGGRAWRPVFKAHMTRIAP